MADDISLRLATMIRAMQQTVLPALPAGNAMAVEQANLVVASLRLIAEQQTYGYAAAMADLRDLHALVADLQAGEAKADGIADVLDHSGQLLRDLPTQAALVDAGRQLRKVADDLIAAQPGDEGVAAQVLEYASRDIARGRAWFAATGLDPAPGEVQPLASIFGSSPV